MKNEIFLYSWREFDITMQKLCSGDWDRTLQFSVYDWNRLAGRNLMLFIFILLITRSGNHELIGKNTCTLRDITMERCSVFLCALRHKVADIVISDTECT